jgi:hypothetical protein
MNLPKKPRKRGDRVNVRFAPHLFEINIHFGGMFDCKLPSGSAGHECNCKDHDHQDDHDQGEQPENGED